MPLGDLRIRTSLCCACALTLAACGNTQLKKVQPAISVTTTPIDFGTLPVLQRATASLQVENVGFAPLTISHVFELDYYQGQPANGGLVGFDFGSALPSFPQQLAAGEKLTLPLIFEPLEEKTYHAELNIESNDPTTPMVNIDLSGVGSTHAVMTWNETGHPGQPSVDFGRVGEGQVALAGLDINSLGTADLIIDGLALTGDPGITFLSSAQTPATLPSGQTDTLQLEFAPAAGAPNPSRASLEIQGTDPANPDVQVPIQGEVNRAPIAVIADPGPVAPGQSVTLDGSASHDPDGDDPISFTDSMGNPGWSVALAPINSAAAVAPNDQAKGQITFDLPGQYVVQLVVSDSTGLQCLQPAQQTIIAKPAQALAVELVWDNADTDIDLHFTEDGAALDSSRDCWAENKTPDFDGGNGPSLIRDAVDHYGPQELVWNAPGPGTYDIYGVFYSAHGSATPNTNATIRIYVFGEVVGEYTQALNTANQAWLAATLQWPSGTVTPVGLLTTAP